MTAAHDSIEVQEEWKDWKGKYTNSEGPKSNSVWTEDGLRVKLADGVILSGQHAELLIIPELASFLFIKKC